MKIDEHGRLVVASLLLVREGTWNNQKHRNQHVPSNRLWIHHDENNLNPISLGRFPATICKPHLVCLPLSAECFLTSGSAAGSKDFPLYPQRKHPKKWLSKKAIQLSIKSPVFFSIMFPLGHFMIDGDSPHQIPRSPGPKSRAEVRSPGDAPRHRKVIDAHFAHLHLVIWERDRKCILATTLG
jgi:hypothetical protein